MKSVYEELIKDYYSYRDEEVGAGMAKYLKDQYPCLGIKRPGRTAIQKNFVKQWKKEKLIDWGFINYLWELPEREFQYLAADLIIALNKELTPEDVPRLQQLIITKSWWDTVDILATKGIGVLCSNYPEVINEWILKWSQSDNIWLARTAILFQFGLLLSQLPLRCDIPGLLRLDLPLLFETGFLLSSPAR